MTTVRVFVVEDDPALRECYARFLRGAGYEVLEAADGLEALTRIPECAPHVVLMDLGLPGIDGWEATRILKRDKRTAQIPIVAITGHTHKTRSADALQAGCDAIVQKPCEGDALLAVVRRFVRDRDGE